MRAEQFARVVGRTNAFLPAGETLDGVPVGLVVRPGSAAEVAACLAEARALGLAVVATGGGTKLGWGNRADAPGLVRLDLARLDRIAELDADEGVATVEPGTRVEILAGRAAASGKRTLLDSGHAGETVGGVIATDAFGPEGSHERRARNELLGLEVALPDGTLARCGGRVVKNVTGFDLVRLQCGAFGTLGVITEATVRLRALPASRVVLGRALPGFADAVESALEIAASGAAPAGLAVLPVGRGAEVLGLFEGGEADVGLRAGRASGERLAEADWERARAARSSAADAARIRLGARPSDTCELAFAVENLAGHDALRLALPGFGCLFAAPPEDALDALVERAAKEGWACMVESAPAGWKRDHDVFGRAPEALPLMRALRERFDPDRVLAPGRFLRGV
jgi:glycolate oxidase FAD binding subunit